MPKYLSTTPALGTLSSALLVEERAGERRNS